VLELENWIIGVLVYLKIGVFENWRNGGLVNC
jgi:hypothetical protein